jgi:hypothetical protein
MIQQQYDAQRLPATVNQMTWHDATWLGSGPAMMDPALQIKQQQLALNMALSSGADPYQIALAQQCLNHYKTQLQGPTAATPPRHLLHAG